MPSQYSSTPKGVSQYSSTPRGVSQYSSTPRCVSQYSSTPRCVSQYSSTPRCVSQYSSTPRGVSQYSSTPRCVSQYSSTPKGVSQYSSTPKGVSQYSSTPKDLSPPAVRSLRFRTKSVPTKSVPTKSVPTKSVPTKSVPAATLTHRKSAADSVIQGNTELTGTSPTYPGDESRARMKTALVIMTGIGFTLGVVFGLLLQLPIDSSLPANAGHPGDHSYKSRRSLSEEKERAHQLQQPQQGPLPPVYVSKSEQVGKTDNSDLLGISKMVQFKKQRSSGKTKNSEYRVLSSHVPNGEKTEPMSTSIRSEMRSIVSNISQSSNRSSGQTDITSLEDSAYLSSVVHGAHWTPTLEASCPRAFRSSEVKEWRKRVEALDVVKMEEGCGRMQNRLVTFRDSSKACARYRLNSDQIQGEIYSYYLAQLLNISNMPPTLLAQVDALSQKWRTVHLQLSLAQWADSKIVVLTQHIGGLAPAHIPAEFRDERRRLEPTLAGLGGKTHDELCELVQWSDLVIFDYLTANLDRVINNMFNKQWNDQMMTNPAHNLEKQKDGTLVFLDNESGLFHGYRLLDKYASFHRTLLDALCVFRPETVKAVKTLHTSGSIGRDLYDLFKSHEPLHKHIAAIPEKNIKILQQRLDDVYQQIVKCEQLYGR
ncbi:Four-jointed box protein 1 [Bulinus truncatus]|nr:Four-jointed box protein 1 [Bulinus truncatus]